MKTTLQSNASNLQTQTMYNLHTKRTLPRDVIKWMQGLDLSYSVKDFRKDMSNGFLIGQIVSRYEPGRIPMHSFENSSNQARRDNNWNQLELFFKKYTLRGEQIPAEQYDKIKANQDPKSQQLFNFVCHLYTVCTKRTIQENPPVLDLPPTQNSNPNLTQSYLLKDDGLEKLDNSRQNNNSSISHSQMLKNSGGLTEKVQDRLPTKKIATKIESGDLVDPTGVGIRPQAKKMTTKRKSFMNFDQSNKDFMGDEDQNQEPDKLIFEHLSDIMFQSMADGDTTTEQLLFPEQGSFTPTELFTRNLSTLNQEFVMQYLTQINLKVDELSQILLREVNETWKFFIYFFKMFRMVGPSNEMFNLLCSMISNYGKNCHAKEPKRMGKVFYEALLMTLVNEVKLMNNVRRRQMMMQLLYDFTGRGIDQKKTALSKLKDLISSSNTLYIEWLSVLVAEQFIQQEGSISANNKPSQLLDDYIYYAQQYLSSSVMSARTAALKILLEIGKVECQMIDKFFISKSQKFSSSREDPEQVCLLVQIYFCLLKELVQSQIYQSLVKGVGSNNLVKAYNPDNEKISQELKSKVNTIAQTISSLSQSTANETIRQLCAIQSLPYIQQNTHIMHVFLDYIYSTGQKQQFFNQKDQKYHEFRSIIIKMPTASLSQIKDHSNEILAEIISLKTNKGYEIEQFLWLINSCLQNINVKKINMEFWQDVSIHIVKSYTKLITVEQFAQLAIEGLIRVFSMQFTFDMKIRQLPQWLAQSINTYQSQQPSSQSINNQISILNDWLNNQYQRTKNEIISFIVNEISDSLSDNAKQGSKKLIRLKK